MGLHFPLRLQLRIPPVELLPRIQISMAITKMYTAHTPTQTERNSITRTHTLQMRLPGKIRRRGPRRPVPFHMGLILQNTEANRLPL